MNLYSEDGVTVSQGNTIRAGGDVVAPGMISVYGDGGLTGHPTWPGGSRAVSLAYLTHCSLTSDRA